MRNERIIVIDVGSYKISAWLGACVSLRFGWKTVFACFDSSFGFILVYVLSLVGLPVLAVLSGVFSSMVFLRLILVGLLLTSGTLGAMYSWNKWTHFFYLRL